MKKIPITQEEWDKIADDFSNKQAGNTRSFAQAMENITRHMSQYKIVKKKKVAPNN